MAVMPATAIGTTFSLVAASGRDAGDGEQGGEQPAALFDMPDSEDLRGVANDGRDDDAEEELDAQLAMSGVGPQQSLNVQRGEDRVCRVVWPRARHYGASLCRSDAPLPPAMR